MSRLTNAIRENICKKALAAGFKERQDALADAEHTLAMTCYEAVIPEAERKAAAKMPDRWLRKDACLRFNASGWDARLTANQAVPVPYSTGCSSLGSLPVDLADRVQTHLSTAKQLREERWRAEHEMDGFLSQFKSIKQMRESWPEGESFYAEFDVERKAGGVPAVRVAEINKLLNLKAA